MDSHRNIFIEQAAAISFFLIFHLLFHYPSPTHAMILNSPTNLISSVCKKTLNFQDCVSALEQNPLVPSTSNLEALARISLEIAVANTTNSKDYIEQMAKSKSTSPSLIPALRQCILGYEMAAVSFNSAIVELDEDILTANYDTKVAGDGAVVCESSLNSTKLDVPSVRARNYYLSFYSNIGDVITNQLLHG